MAGTSKKTEKYVNIIVCVGAAVVIFGAWAKILHKSFADVMLTIGLITEACIFLVYAFLPPPGQEMAALIDALPKKKPEPDSPMKAFDEMMREAEISPSNLKKLNENFTQLGVTLDGLKGIADASTATNNYAKTTQEATSSMIALKTSYDNAAKTVGHFNEATNSTKGFHEQVQSLTRNLSSLNTIYELELQDTNNHLKAMNNYYTNLVAASQVMQGSVGDAQKAQEQIALLAKNLGSLNSVYGNMLAAMQAR
ncbi:MAG: gliding motility protein GldL [Bacteroidetes bacterium]|nr:gliding motility protein GldL [Bacteroidota bacterium]